MSDPKIDFSCQVCGKECDVAPDPPDRAVCEEHCPGHEYNYDQFERGHFCQICNKRRDDSYYNDHGWEKE